MLTTKALARENRNQKIRISPAKHALSDDEETQRPQRKEIIFIRTWRSSRLGGTNIRIRDVSYRGKFAQAAQFFKHSSTKSIRWSCLASQPLDPASARFHGFVTKMRFKRIADG